MKNVIILTREDKYIPLQQWQEQYGLEGGSTKIGRHFSYTEPKFKEDLKEFGKLIVCEPLIKVMDRYRELIDEPVSVNSFNRTEEKQAQLTEKGFRTAKVSPHVEKMAADLDTLDAEGTYIRVAKLKQAARELGISIRIGYKDYLVHGQTFIHLDVCPEYYATGKPRFHDHHPAQWENSIEW